MRITVVVYHEFVIAFDDADIDFAICLGGEDDVVADGYLVGEAVEHARTCGNLTFLYTRVHLGVVIFIGFARRGQQGEVAELVPSDGHHVMLEHQVLIEAVDAPYGSGHGNPFFAKPGYWLLLLSVMIQRDGPSSWTVWTVRGGMLQDVLVLLAAGG